LNSESRTKQTDQRATSLHTTVSHTYSVLYLVVVDRTSVRFGGLFQTSLLNQIEPNRLSTEPNMFQTCLDPKCIIILRPYLLYFCEIWAYNERDVTVYS
jgi:hypothetical protein